LKDASSSATSRRSFGRSVRNNSEKDQEHTDRKGEGEKGGRDLRQTHHRRLIKTQGEPNETRRRSTKEIEKGREPKSTRR